MYYLLWVRTGTFHFRLISWFRFGFKWNKRWMRTAPPSSLSNGKIILHYHFSFWLYFWKLSLNFAPKQNRNLDFSIHSLNNKKQNVCSRCMNGGRKTTKTELRVSNEFRMCSKTNVHRTSSVNTIIILRHLLFSSFNFAHCTDNLNLNQWRWREKKNVNE